MGRGFASTSDQPRHIGQDGSVMNSTENSETHLSARLKAAREACGKSQQQAAVELGVSRPLLIAMEKGTREVRPEELVKLARIYGRHVSELIRPAPPPVAVGARFRAALASASSEELSSLINHLERLGDDYLDLVRRSNAELPRRYPASRSIGGLPPEEEAEDLATEERNRLGLGDGPVERLREVLETEVGIRVFIINLPSHVAGLFIFAEPLGGCIALNAKHPPERRRLTLAHEYAHFLVSRDRPEVTLLKGSARAPEAERFADAFAAAFLMPRSGLSRRFHELKKSNAGKVTPTLLLQLARTYWVSVAALTLRLEDLRLLRPGTWDRLRELNFQPHTAEQLLGLPRQPMEAECLPQHYRSLAVQLYADSLISEGQLARYLHTDRVGAREIYRSLTASQDVTADGSPEVFNLIECSG
jgi:Zn-dependent peptidase ImmA (M78 family)/DNA-binding XRE family transcriptional regulator